MGSRDKKMRVSVVEMREIGVEGTQVNTEQGKDRDEVGWVYKADSRIGDTRAGIQAQ